MSLTLDQGKTLGIVGESGSGKTVLSRAIMGLLPPASTTQTGSVRYDGAEILNAPNDELRKLWSTHIAMVFQDPMTSLNPVQRIGNQITEPLKIHLKLSKSEAKETALSLLMQVGIPSPVERYEAYPAQLSGGMRQRVMIAIALACAPRLLMADEPTTGLDVTVQAQILDLLSQLQRDRDMAMILVTHDLGVVATRTDEIIVMYAGNVVERAPTNVLFKSMAMPYTEALLKSTPRIAEPEPHPPDRHRGPATRPPQPSGRLPVLPALPVRAGQVPPGEAAPRGGGAGPQLRLLVPADRRRRSPPARAARGGDGVTDTTVEAAAVGTDPLLSVEDLHVSFHKGSVTVQAVAGITFTLRQGETLGLVGESGCGKSTTGRAIVQVEKATSGRIRFGDTELTRSAAATCAPCAPRCR